MPDLQSVIGLFAPLARLRFETAGFAFLDADRRLLGLRHTSSHEVDRVVMTMRTVVADVIAFDATAVVMAHNHPSGDPRPSQGDLALTRKLVRLLDPLDVRLIDHLVLGAGATSSFRQLGLL